MRRLVATLGIILIAAAFGGIHTANASAATCSNSFPADGHNGPWYGSNAIHGNTVKVTCPTSTTHWSIQYEVEWSNTGGPESNWHVYFADDVAGNGTAPQFSEGISASCDGGLHIWRTHIHNYITGGNMNKPSGGSGTFLGC
jgi:hypothetical protein